jgi:predicted short-subunit dehydrogenase-like oxidoreductase (DUF2520 family)
MAIMKIGIIGAGKVGIATGYVMQKNGLEVVAISDRLESALDTARRYLGASASCVQDNMEVLNSADVIAITTQDGMINDVVQEISAKPGRLNGKLFYHTSGAHAASILSPLDQKGALLGSLHPLQTFPDIDSAIGALPSTYIFIDGDERGLETLRLLGERIGHRVVEIEGRHKVLYHLAAVFVCNLLCALLYTGQGIAERIRVGLEPFFPIIDATLRNIEKKGPLMSLTGPVIRGDAGTVAAHIEAMSNMDLHRQVYKALSLVALEMVRERKVLDEAALERLAKVLGEI